MAIRTTMEAIEDMPLFAAARPRPTLPPAAAACTKKAERAGFDTAAAKAAVLELLADGRARSGEELVDHCLRLGLVPHDHRAFGSVFSRLAQAGAIEAVGFTERKKGNGTAGGRMWRAIKEVTT
jgi:hypothetical protein